ncbi:MAG: sn-glycerol-3-phosphate ABC transporter ATP-binding protein UgpC [Gammaproteobacteria bacterium]|nr:MAG: sn-glycerol-3-phosphate ABC transporter ATP-binding protein UgpC [Gammaproteobacteria bacterium]
MAELKINALRKSYGDIEILKGIDLHIRDHEFVVFVGPSGCGKSTLLRSIAGLEEVTSGQIVLGGRDITGLKPAERDLAMVFQSYALYPHMNVRKNMSFALELAGVDKATIEAKVKDAARILELTHLLDRKPKDLSGGQRQRVAIGRAIVRHPQVFLFDEPLSNLDAALRVQMRLELARLHHELNATMIYVTHDQVEAMTLADRVVVMNQGRIEQVGTPLELYHHPVNQFVAGFIGTPKMAFIPARVIGGQGHELTIQLPSGEHLTLPRSPDSIHVGAEVTLGIRPEHMRIVSPENANLTGQLDVTEHLGSDTYCHVNIDGGHTLTVRQGGDYEGRFGEIVGVDFDLSRAHLFDSEGNALDSVTRQAA